MLYATNRRFFITEQGQIGLAPKEARRGDTICVLFGCSVPVVLREKQDIFTFVGECYVDGLMHGEAVDLADQGKLEKKEWVIF
jgi:hypothetical protein